MNLPRSNRTLARVYESLRPKWAGETYPTGPIVTTLRPYQV
jgi:hypothetical protein